MTVPANSDFVQSSIANGLTTSFPFGFKVLDDEDLTVEVDGVVTTTGFSVSGIGSNTGGSVDFLSPPANGARVTRYLNPVLKRDTNYQQFGDWDPDTVNPDFDRLWLALQSMSQFRKRAIKLPVETTTDQVIPQTAAERANTLVGFDANGNVSIRVPVDLDLAVVSSFIATLIDDPDAEEARATLEALGIAGGNLSGAINEVRATVASHATTADIWGAAGNAIFFSGNATITNFPAAPQAGARRRLHCAAGITFTNNANISVQGGANYTTASDDIVELEAVTTLTFKATIFKNDGTALVAPALLPSQAGNAGRVLKTDGSSASWSGSPNFGTAVAWTSGTAINFTSIPSWVRRITVIFNSISTNGTSNFLIRIGTLGGIQTTGYESSSEFGGTGVSDTSGFVLRNSSAASVHSGHIVLTLTSGNLWIASGVVRPGVTSGTGSGGIASGYKDLGAALDRLQITTVGGADAGDGGSINIIWE